MTEDSSSQVPPPPPPAQRAPQYQTPYPGPYPPPYAGQYAAPYGLPSRPRRSAWFYISIITAAIVAFGIVLWAVGRSVSKSLNGDVTIAGSSGDQIGVIEISGVILDADKIDTQLRKFGDNDSVKAIILHINSPGGGAAVSQEVYHEVLRVRQEKHKKIIASVESVGASGAYYIASACDSIYANEASVVGSIGVIMEWTEYGDLLKWAKLKPVVLHAGALKDAGDPSHDLTPQEQAYFQSLIDNMYGQFIHDVAVGRNVPDKTIQPLATGQVWTGQQARALGLVDRAGGLRVALMDTAREVGIKGEPPVKKPAKKKNGLLTALAGSDADDQSPARAGIEVLPSKAGFELLPSRAGILDQAPGFYFLWK